MSIITFLYNDNEFDIEYKKGEKIDSLFQKFGELISINYKNLIFLNNNTILNGDCTEDSILENQDGKKIILVEEKTSANKYIKSKNIICPECQENASISIEDYIISISNCKNGHKIDNLSIDEFENTRNHNMPEIICDICSKNKKEGYIGNIFFWCITCHKNVCQNCKILHDKDHNIINHENIYYICDIHGQEYISYCFECKKNLCLECKNCHNNHEKKDFKEFNKDKKDKLFMFLENFQHKVSLMISKINEIINICTIVKNNYEIIFRIKKSICENINQNFTNIQDIINQKFINNNFEKDLDSIINGKNLTISFENILRIKEMMLNSEELQNCILMKYKIKEKEKIIKILGKEFIENNIDKCKIINNKKEYELAEFIDIDTNKDLNNNILEIKLTGIKNITNAYSMFSGCSSLISLKTLPKNHIQK